MSNAVLLFLQKLFENRVAMLLALVLSAAGFGYVLWKPDVIRWAAATTFTLLVYVPLVKPVRIEQSTTRETEA